MLYPSKQQTAVAATYHLHMLGIASIFVCIMLLTNSIMQPPMTPLSSPWDAQAAAPMAAEAMTGLEKIMFSAPAVYPSRAFPAPE